MLSLIKYLRKIVIFVIGSLLLALGLILIPLPGPGILICFAGLVVLSLEFDWAKPHVARTKTHLKKLSSRSRASKPANPPIDEE